MRHTWYPALLALLASSHEAVAHHSIARVYDSSHRSSVIGTVAEFRFINPHPLLIVEVVTDAESGATEAWQLEMDNRFELERIGMTADTFAPGDRIVAEGSLGLTQPNTLYLRRLERPADGLRYEQVGYNPRLDTGNSQ